MKKNSLSLILPCYNEGEHFTKSATYILDTLKKTNIDFEIIFVEDKSTDNTKELIEQFIKKNSKSRINVIFHTKNSGRGQTVSNGIIAAKGQFVGFIDIDCEISPTYIINFFEKLQKGYDIVCAQRYYKAEISGWLRAFISKTYVFLMQRLLGSKLVDTEAGYKFFNKEQILKIIPNVVDKHWFWDTETMIRSEKSGLKITFIPVEFIRKLDKTSTVHILKDSLTYFYKLLEFRKKIRNHTEIDNYWQEKSPAFTSQYTSIFSFPLSPVGWFLKIRHQKIINLLKDLKGNKFLSVGCGSAMVMKEALNQGRFAIGIDYSRLMLKIASANLSHFPKTQYQLIEGNAIDLPIQNRSIDILLASGLTDYLTIDETKKFMSEVRRVIKTKGFAIITFPKKESPLGFLRSGIGLFLRETILRLPPIESKYSKTDIQTLFLDINTKILSWDTVMSTMWLVLAQKI